MLNIGISDLFVYNFTFPSYPRVAPGCSDSQFSRLGNHSECNKTLKWKLITTIVLIVVWLIRQFKKSILSGVFQNKYLVFKNTLGNVSELFSFGKIGKKWSKQFKTTNTNNVICWCDYSCKFIIMAVYVHLAFWRQIVTFRNFPNAISTF